MNKIYQGDSLAILKTLPDNVIDCCITSPPYWGLRDYCVEGQIGLETSPVYFIQKLVDVFAEVRRCLKPEGTCWINIGDTYAHSGCTRGEFSHKKTGNGLKAKDLVGIPWMLAFALRNDGWYLRQEIIWHKTNALPESVTDRCTKAHEQIFLLTKSQKYYWDKNAISTPAKESSIKRLERDVSNSLKYPEKKGLLKTMAAWEGNVNKRSVWSISTASFKGQHFATFPEKLIEPMVLAGCPEGGIVLDPFMGAGTTALVACKFNRQYVGIELNSDYIKIAEDRLKECQITMWGNKIT